MSETKAQWFIVYRGSRIPTGCGKSDVREAEAKLADWLVDQHKPELRKGLRPDEVFVGDVLMAYGEAKAQKHAKPKETLARLAALNRFFYPYTIAEVDDALCDKYREQSAHKSAARRQLEDLRSALNWYRDKGFVTMVPTIAFEEKPDPRHRWLKRDEAAKLLRAAWRMRQSWKGKPSDRRTGQHVARFILVALYTGTRSAAVCGAAVRPTEGGGFVDLGRGVFFYRRASDAVETKKRQPPVRLPDRLLAHMRRWARTPVQIKTKGVATKA